MVAQEAFDVRGSTINKTEGSLGSRAGNYHPVLIDAIRAADNGRNVARHCFDVVTVSTNPWRGLRGIAIGSNKDKRERAAKVVLAVAATRGSLPPGAQRPRTGVSLQELNWYQNSIENSEIRFRNSIFDI